MTATAKGPAAFRTISEASAEVGVPSHVLRFWESKFSFIRPMKRAGGRRFYRPQDLDLLRSVRALLHEEGYTIRGVQKLHREGGVVRLARAAGSPDPELAEPADAPALIAPDEPDAAPTPDSESVDDGQTDLFAEPASEPAPPPEPGPERDTHATASEPVASRLVLEAPARERLRAVLGDLEGVKAGIDALLSPDAPA